MTRGSISSDFWKLWGGSTVSNLGDGIRQTALPLLAVTLTTDPLAIGAVTAASFLPWLGSFAGGVLVDRLDRRRLILIGQVVRAASVGGFAVLVSIGQVHLALLYAVALIIGSGEVVVDSAMQAAIPHVAGGDLDRANSRFASGQFVAGEVVGGPIGGALFAASGSLPFFLDGVSFGAGAVLIALIGRPLQQTADADLRTNPVIDDLREGIRFLFAEPVLRGMTIAVTVSNLAVAAASALLVLLVTERLGGSELIYGLIVASGALGGLTGALSSARLVAVLGRRTALVAPFAVMTVALIGMGSASAVVPVGLGLFAAQYGGAVYNVSAQSIRQRLTPDRLLGRVIAGMRFFGMGAVPVGAVGGGFVARFVGVERTIVAAGAMHVIAAVAVIATTAERDLDGNVTI